MTTTSRPLAAVGAAVGATVGAALLSPLLLATPAHASQPVTAFGGVWVGGWGATTATVCAYGEVDDGAYVAGAWNLVVAGARADGLPPVAVSVPHVGPTFGDCLTVTTGALLAGITASLTYVGAGTADVVGVAGLVGARSTATSPFAISYTASG